MAEAPAVPRPAATVLLLREAPGAIEVLMTRRHAELAVLGGSWVFPGGVVEPEDAPAAGYDPLGAIRAAACRETFEEAGVLLAFGPAGSPSPAQVRDVRARVAAGAAFAEAVEAEGLRLTLDSLVRWAHWITPSHARARFDTSFFVAAMPAGQEPLIDDLEAVDHKWLPAAAAGDGSEPALAPPTRLNLLDVHDAFVRHGSLSLLLAGEAARPVPVIVPKLILIEGAPTTVVLPWDPGYADMPGESVPLDELPDHLARLPSRLIFDPAARR
jgi:8-oxo-dGTP pyrophosphatase MutT (NUDIX family)